MKSKPIIHFKVKLQPVPVPIPDSDKEDGKLRYQMRPNGFEIDAHAFRVTAGNALVFSMDGIDVMAFNAGEWLICGAADPAPVPTKEEVEAAIAKHRDNGEFERAHELRQVASESESPSADDRHGEGQ